MSRPTRIPAQTSRLFTYFAFRFKIRSAASASSTYEFTSQLFFDESFLSSLYTQQTPYTTKGDSGRLSNASDGIYNQGGSELLLTPTASGGGYAAAINIGMDVSA